MNELTTSTVDECIDEIHKRSMNVSTTESTEIWCIATTSTDTMKVSMKFTKSGQVYQQLHPQWVHECINDIHKDDECIKHSQRVYKCVKYINDFHNDNECINSIHKESVKDHRYLLFFLNLGLFCEQRQQDDDDDDDDDEDSWIETLKTHILLPFRHEM